MRFDEVYIGSKKIVVGVHCPALLAVGSRCRLQREERRPLARATNRGLCGFCAGSCGSCGSRLLRAGSADR